MSIAPVRSPETAPPTAAGNSYGRHSALTLFTPIPYLLFFEGDFDGPWQQYTGLALRERVVAAQHLEPRELQERFTQAFADIG